MGPLHTVAAPKEQPHGTWLLTNKSSIGYSGMSRVRIWTLFLTFLTGPQVRSVAQKAPTKNGRAGLFILAGEKQMTKTEIKELKAILKAKQIELPQIMRNRDGIQKTPDALDETQLATERELATRNLERESRLLRSVRQALSRIEEGTYGLCLNCEEEISAKRLKALPWTSLCIHCQQQADDNRERVIEPRESLLVNAA